MKYKSLSRTVLLVAYIAFMIWLLLENLYAADRIAIDWMNVQIDMYKESLNGQILSLQDPNYLAILSEGNNLSNTEFKKRFYQTLYLYIIPTILLFIGWRWLGGKTKK